jgi:exodeoxyribonuclease VII large subunit
MQGEKAEESIIEALDKIFERENDFDVVVIIRGGGATSDLECFNNYNLAYHITQFPIPIITGIGHERDETVADIVAHTSLKTPTAVAEFLIDNAVEFENLVDSLENRFNTMIRNLLSIEKQKLASITQNLNYIFIKTIQNKRIWIQNSFQRLGLLIRQFRKHKSDRLDNYTNLSGIYTNFKIKQGFAHLKEYNSNLHRKTLQMIQLSHEKLNVYERNINYLDPINVLRRGFSITISRGKLIKDSSYLKDGDELMTTFQKGTARSVVIKK